MAENTAIEWTDATFNPWWGCQKVSPACDHCYAERDAKRFAAGQVLWGVDSQRRTFGDKHWGDPAKWAKRAFVACSACGWRGMHTKLQHVGGDHFCPTCGSAEWRAARMRVFCASMGDWLDLDAPIGEFVRLLDTIRITPELDWLLLSKRIGNWRKRMEEAAAATVGTGALNLWITKWLFGETGPRHVWLGSTVINQPEYDRDIGKLLRTPAAVHFLSVEPMLGHIDMRIGGASMPDYSQHRPLAPLSWVICGGESGPKARPMHPDWPRALRDQCAAAGMPFLFKQWGEWLPAKDGRSITGKVLVLEGAAPFAKNPEWHGFEDGQQVARVGKKAAGRLLDGVTHDGYPGAVT